MSVICSLAPFLYRACRASVPAGRRTELCLFTGFVISIAGVVLLSLYTGSRFELNPLGDLLALGASIVWAFYAVLTRKIGILGYHPVQVVRRSFFWGLLFMLPVLAPLGFRMDFSWLNRPLVLANILFLDVVPRPYALSLGMWPCV